MWGALSFILLDAKMLDVSVSYVHLPGKMRDIVRWQNDAFSPDDDDRNRTYHHGRAP
jgi:hypothetical protein